MRDSKIDPNVINDVAAVPIVSDFVLDRFLRNELTHGERQEFESMLETPAVKARLDDMRAERDAFSVAAPSFAGLQAKAATRRSGAFSMQWFSRAAAALGGIGATVAVVLFVLPLVSPAPPDDGNLTKGGFLSHYVSRDGVVSRRTDLSPGDKVRFAIDAAGGAFVAVLSRDGAGTVSVYAPLERKMMWASGHHTFSNSTILDAVVGEEVFVGVRCTEAVPIGDLERAMAKEAKSGALRMPAGCEVDVKRLNKREPRP